MGQDNLRASLKTLLAVAGIVVAAVKDGIQVQDLKALEQLVSDPIKQQILDLIANRKATLDEIKALSVSSGLALALEILPEIKALIASGK